MIYTTLNKIRANNPCSEGWEKLLRCLGKTKADDEPLSMLTILKSNGFDDAVWCLIACEGIDKEARLFAVTCARRVQHLMDAESIKTLDVVERYAHGKATGRQLTAARAAAVDAARFAAGDAARAAAWAAARAAAEAAARAASRAAASDDAGNAAWDAERKWQEQEFKLVFCGGEK